MPHHAHNAPGASPTGGDRPKSIASKLYAKGKKLALGEGDFGQDLKAAAECFQQAAAQGYAKAQMQLAVCYSTGKGKDRDPQRAVVWWARAALEGHGRSQFCLGDCYEHGQGVDKDCQAASVWYSKSSAQGVATATRALAGLYERGDGVLENPAKAEEYYILAAEQELHEQQKKCAARFHARRAQSFAFGPSKRKGESPRHSRGHEDPAQQQGSSSGPPSGVEAASSQTAEKATENGGKEAVHDMPQPRRRLNSLLSRYDHMGALSEGDEDADDSDEKDSSPRRVRSHSPERHGGSREPFKRPQSSQANAIALASPSSNTNGASATVSKSRSLRSRSVDITPSSAPITRPGNSLSAVVDIEAAFEMELAGRRATESSSDAESGAGASSTGAGTDGGHAADTLLAVSQAAEAGVTRMEDPAPEVAAAVKEQHRRAREMRAASRVGPSMGMSSDGNDGGRGGSSGRPRRLHRSSSTHTGSASSNERSLERALDVQRRENEELMLRLFAAEGRAREAENQNRERAVSDVAESKAVKRLNEEVSNLNIRLETALNRARDSEENLEEAQEQVDAMGKLLVASRAETKSLLGGRGDFEAMRKRADSLQEEVEALTEQLAVARCEASIERAVHRTTSPASGGASGRELRTRSLVEDGQGFSGVGSPSRLSRRGSIV